MRPYCVKHRVDREDGQGVRSADRALDRERRVRSAAADGSRAGRAARGQPSARPYDSELLGGHRVRPRDRAPEAHLLRALDRGLHGVHRTRRAAGGLRGLPRRGRDRRHLTRSAPRRARALRPSRSTAGQLGIARLRATARLGTPRDRAGDRRDRSDRPPVPRMSLTVDLHHHVIPEFYWDATNEDGNVAGGINPPRWSLDGAIAYLDEARIDVAIASISTPGVHLGDDAAARILARRVNDYLADVKRDRPDRFGAFAALPLPDIEGSLDQIAYALDVLELDGVSVMTNAGGSYLGDSRFDPIFAELQRRAAVVFVHPIASPDPIAHTLGLPDTAPRLPRRHVASDREAPLQQHVRPNAGRQVCVRARRRHDPIPRLAL